MDSVDVEMERVVDCLTVSERGPGRFAVSMRCGHEIFERCDTCKNPSDRVRHPDETLTQVCETSGKDDREVQRRVAALLKENGWRRGMTVRSARFALWGAL